MSLDAGWARSPSPAPPCPLSSRSAARPAGLNLLPPARRGSLEFRIPRAPRSVPAYGGSPYARSILGAPALRALRARGYRLPFFRSLAPRALAPSLAAGARFPAPMGTGLGSAPPPLSGRVCVSFGRSVPLRRPFGSGVSCAPVGAWLRPSRRAGLALVTLEVSKIKDVLRTIPHPPTLLWIMACRGIP